MRPLDKSERARCSPPSKALEISSETVSPTPGDQALSQIVVWSEITGQAPHHARVSGRSTALAMIVAAASATAAGQPVPSLASAIPREKLRLAPATGCDTRTG